MNPSKFLPLVIVVALAACGQKSPATDAAAANTGAPAATSVAAAAPAAVIVAPAPAPAAPAVAVASTGDLVKGEQVYTATCQACHAAGVLGAPKFGDKAAWQPRIAKGKDALYTDALNGFKMMPPKGGNALLKDEELKAAVDYMVSKAT